MAGKSAILSVRIVADAKAAAAGFNQASRDVANFEDKSSKSLERFKAGVDKAAVLTGAAATAYGAFAYQTIQSASELEQSTGAVNAVFGEQAAEIEALAATAARSVGLSAAEYQNMAAVMGAQLGNMGLAQEEVVGTTETLITLGADLASMFGGTTSDAVAALSSLLRGERDPIERYGVSIKQADIDARLAAEGLSGLEGEARKQAETQATLALLFEQTSAAQGNFARETDTAAGATQIARAEWENAKAALGEQLLPYVVKGAQVLADLARMAGENEGLFIGLGVAIGTAASAAFGLKTLASTIEAVQIVSKALNFTMASSPVGWWITGLAALATMLVTLYYHSEDFRAIIAAVIDWLAALARMIYDSWAGEAIRWTLGIDAAAADPGFTAERAADIVTFSMAPAITAAEAITRGPDIGKITPNAPAPKQTVINVTVSDSVVGDEYLLAKTVRKALDRYDIDTGARLI